MMPSSHRRDFAALLGTDDNRWATNATNFPDTIITTVASLVNESISNVSVFSGQPSYLVPALNARNSLQCGIQNNRRSNAEHFRMSVQQYRIPTIKKLRFCTPGRIRTCGQREAFTLSSSLSKFQARNTRPCITRHCTFRVLNIVC
jgi:hypothetical protein